MLGKLSCTLLLLVVVSCYRPAESVLCRNTTITANLSDPEVRHNTIGDSLERFLRSPIAPRRTALGDQFVQYVLQVFRTTDSAHLRSQLQAFWLLSTVSVLWSDPARGDYCGIAEAINASALYARSQDNQIANLILDALSSSLKATCDAVAAIILRNMGCKRLPEIPCYTGPNCTEGGYVYEIKDILKYFGELLPCEMKRYINQLYESTSHEDRSLAALIVEALTTAEVTFVKAVEVDKMIELANMLMDPNEKLCCCKTRRERLAQICQRIEVTNVDELREMFTTECPPEAAYAK